MAYIKNFITSFQTAMSEAKAADREIRKAYEELGKNIKDIDNSITDNAKKAAAYRAEYERFMSTKRIRTLTTEESKRARIIKANEDHYTKLRDKEFETLKARLSSGEIQNEEYYAILAKLRDSYFSQGSAEWEKYTAEIVGYYEKMRESEFNNLRLNLALGKISNAEYYDELGRLRDKYFEEGSEGWAKYTLEIASYNQSVIDKQQKELSALFSRIDMDFSQEFSGLLQKQDSMKEKLLSVSEIYQKVTVGGKGKKQYSWLQLSDIDFELKKMSAYNDSLLKIKNITSDIFSGLGFDESKTNKLTAKFFEDINALNFNEAGAFSDYLSRMDRTRLTDYLEKWAKKLDLGEMIAKNLYSDEAEELSKRYAQTVGEAFSEELENRMGEIPDSFFDMGSDACESFRDGFLNMLEGVAADIKEKVDMRINGIIPSGAASITNNSSYNIYGSGSPAETALEIFKKEEMRRLLAGE